MAVKPTVDPKWSVSNNPADNIEPTPSLKNGGVPAGGVWGREFLNWQFYAISQWIDWVRSSALDKDNNLSDLTNTATARTNLGLNNASVTLGANTTGNAATATKLATARTINGTAFDGSTNITIPQTAFHPIGMTYIQFPGRSSPSELFGGTWSQLFNTEGVFFRTEGGNASAFNDGIQGGAIQSHNHSASSSSAGAHTHTTRGGLGQGNNYDRASGAYSNNTFMSDTVVQAAGAHTHAITINNTGTVETRPINRTIRVWVRTA